MSRASHILLAAATLAAALLLPVTPAAAHVSCTVSSPGVAFGVYDPKSATSLDGAGTITVSCDQSTGGVTVTGSGGGSGNAAARKMTNGASNLNYNLYTNSARTVVFSSGGSSQYTFNNNFTQVSATVYGRITALQNVTAGSYSDSVIMTVTF